MNQKTGRTPFITLIMPVYNAEKYLRKAIDSVLAQTFQDFELLLIDDCSPDGSGAICDEYAQNHAGKVRVIHLEKNGGLSNARNNGMDNASGKYICFMDPDDTIDSNLFEKAVPALQEHHVSAVIYGMTEEYYDAKGILKYTKCVEPKENRLILDRMALREEIIHLEEQTLYGYSCNKIYDLSRIREEGLYFENVKLIEDVVFNIHYFKEAGSVYIMAEAPYHYGKRIENSLTSQFVPNYYELHMRRVRMIFDQYQYWNLCTPEVRKILGNLYIRYTVSALQRNCDPRAGMDHKQRKDWMKAQYASYLYAALIGNCAPENKLLKIFARLFRKKRVNISLFCGRAVYIVKNKMPIVFAKLKQKN
ncbi:MAG: glycosyltransferase family 2 protein [Clostridiales bacterium]|nr:glycosyltransferase family 2 protein [Clostridiales bacterium]